MQSTILLIFSLVCCEAAKYQHCAKSLTGTLLSPPDTADCSKPTQHDANAPITYHNVSIYTKRSTAIIVNGFLAYSETKTVAAEMTWYLSTWHSEPSVTRKSLPVSTALSMSDYITNNVTDPTLAWLKDLKWDKEAGVFRTDYPIHITYWLLYTKTYHATNYFMEPAQITSMDGSHLYSTAGDMGGCHADTGFCHTSLGTWVYNSTDIGRSYCPYELMGTFEAVKQDSLVVFEQQQLAFSIANDKQSHHVPCIHNKLYKPDQGNVMLDLPDSAVNDLHLSNIVSNDIENATELNNIEISDPENSKFQFTVYTVMASERKDIRTLFTSVCMVSNRNIHVIRQLLILDPTAGVRAMMGDNSYVAEWHGEALALWKCSEVEVTKEFLDGNVHDTCYQYMPVLLSSGELYFVQPGSRDLVATSPVIPCEKAKHFVIRDSNGNWISTGAGTRPVQHLITDTVIPPSLQIQAPIITFNSTSLMKQPDWSYAIRAVGHQMSMLLVENQRMQRLIAYVGSKETDVHEYYSLINATGRFFQFGADLFGAEVNTVGGAIGSLLGGTSQLFVNIVTYTAVAALVVLVVFVSVKMMLDGRCSKRNPKHALSELLSDLQHKEHRMENGNKYVPQPNAPLYPPV